MDRTHNVLYTLSCLCALVLSFVFTPMLIYAGKITYQEHKISELYKSVSQPQIYKSLEGLLDFLFEKNILSNIEYYVDWGTLLGCTRQQNIIQHDGDIDISVPVNKLSTIIQRLKPYEKQFIIEYNNMNKFFGSHMKIQIIDRITGGHIDIEPVEVIGGYVYKAYHPIFLKFPHNKILPRTHQCIPYNYIYPLKKGTLNNYIVNVPNLKEDLLIHYYGINWQTPKIFRSIQ